MARRKKEEAPVNTERWLTTYADLISLLMIFFVVMFASSEVSKDKLLAISESLRRALNKESVQASAVGISILSSPTRSVITAASEAIEEAAKAFGIDKSVSFSTDERGTIISIVDSVFFDPGETVIKPRVVRLLKEVAQFCKDTDAQVIVEGHTDDQQIHTPEIPSNWELSALRATEVVRFFLSEVGFNPTKISASAYGDTRPLMPNINDENRARNRRINIILVNAETRSKKADTKALTQLELLERTRQVKEEEVEKMLNPYAGNATQKK
ncbi:chemotaxis protein MotB [bacterium (Candidatus Blackallbacteria) CG17_big_fil_post_rev_8_21_14_2_50_48_46]|uniref:Chemotaxis protein MotB n=1 Tax=bacterium (Candidatus Blackallbacteria) CG17_big_fil_post_rev_8_21_14_2_50_48_46 TaxID=2014261 RepID=A0A2M7GB25_9BACT|nr:MAG: chemotaxis protein MotB [bacterium (Candidatus Blackallbacteria) CG18_big_fil_WC_8_21_14_2_50_49_26]PIW19377.1 MAG: chemotaxis protein MotB [bacterium (Candidatus Blackallbacteria) CG17_big_fil_post_rev_8_21_14_2_50_48_46]PIW49019.1 MAG: chemotaxis protein MotB [bacterium (Candidatus Blackallbacteria) CG13_big_fil_rev_8_21_14_2_50_49_14]